MIIIIIWAVLGLIGAFCTAGLRYLLHLLIRDRGPVWRPGDQVPDMRRRSSPATTPRSRQLRMPRSPPDDCYCRLARAALSEGCASVQ
jgi:hypothetical protein